ncbi:SIMPL domain-containing protein [Pseudoduganella chitinolytica]|uniref:SIMPL domain-containing protein n=1 Tax=Pseudoduganella chitinolytica TaxID=34070 RepID=A0ABY8BH61_9BURK|nr:SIMPL domain-containing protein [Pseudoduganella chitinolytica]WEF33609.1 SIMPL domain-containing protein [Pseudoduganella chitinolytica]
MTVLKSLLAAAFVLGSVHAHAQTAPTAGTTVVIPATGEVTAPNDQAIATLAIEEQDKDKAAAASRVNTKMKQGLEILRAQDPQASLKTMGYYTYPVYPEDRPVQPLAPHKPRLPTAWRVGQYVEVKTTNLAGLPKTVAAAQKVLTLNAINFGLTPAALRRLDDQRIAATYKALNERIASVAKAMGRPVTDAILDTVDFEGSGNYAGGRESAPAPMAMRAMAMKDSAEVAEPSFEPGETTLDMRLVGKVRFK